MTWLPFLPLLCSLAFLSGFILRGRIDAADMKPFAEDAAKWAVLVETAGSVDLMHKAAGDGARVKKYATLKVDDRDYKVTVERET